MRGKATIRAQSQCRPPMTGLHKTELALNDAEGMRKHRSHLHDGPVDLFLGCVPFSALARLAHDSTDLAFIAHEGIALGADIARIGANQKR